MALLDNWSIDFDRDNLDAVDDITGFYGSLTNGNYIFARLWGDYPKYKKIAKLISKAPEILRGLRILFRYVKIKHDPEYLRENVLGFAEIEKLLEELNDVL